MLYFLLMTCTLMKQGYTGMDGKYYETSHDTWPVVNVDRREFTTMVECMNALSVANKSNKDMGKDCKSICMAGMVEKHEGEK